MSMQSSTACCASTRALTGCCSTSSSRFPTTSRRTASTCTASRRASRYSWTRVPTTGGLSVWAASWAGRGSRSKTCKTQTGAILSLCWAKAHGMTLMVQDLSNPMLAQVPHVLLGRARRHDHGCRVQRHAVLPRRVASRGSSPPRTVPPPRRPARPVHDSRSRFRVSHRRDHSYVAACRVLGRNLNARAGPSSHCYEARKHRDQTAVGASVSETAGQST